MAVQNTKLRKVLQTGFIVLFLSALCLPMLGQLAGMSSWQDDELRAPGVRPNIPTSWSDALQWSTSVDGYLNDHFGLRRALVDLRDWINLHAFRTFASPQVLLGKDGRVFLTSHTADGASRYSAIHAACGFGITDNQWQAAADSYARVLNRAAAAGLNAYIVIVPTPPALYATQLPQWLQRQCASGQRPATAISTRLPPALRARLIDPFAMMAAMTEPEPAIHKLQFHWQGLGPLRVEEWLSEGVLKRPPAPAVGGVWQLAPSDLKGFLPGLDLEEKIYFADYNSQGIKVCFGPDCFPEMQPAAAMLADVSRHTGKTENGRILLLTDSYGAYIAGNFARHFSAVWHLGLNNVERLSAAQGGDLRRVALTEYKPDVVLMIVNDGTALSYLDRVEKWVFPQ